VQGSAISFLHRDHLATVKMVTNGLVTVTFAEACLAYAGVHETARQLQTPPLSL
jgi:hypothetical protein